MALDGPLNIDHWKDESADAIRKRNQYWSILRQMHKEQKLTSVERVSEYMVEHYGIKPILTVGGQYTSDYQIVDEAKHLIYMLKYL